MALSDRDPNFNGRNSRSSKESSRFKEARYAPPVATSDVLSVAPGVLGMLKTTTETGDIGALSMQSSRLPKIPNGMSRYQQALAPSRTSSHYSRTASLKSKGSVHSARSAPNVPRHNTPYLHPPFAASRNGFLPPKQNGAGPYFEDSRSLTQTLPGFYGGDHRSSSLTQSTVPQRILSNHPSLVNLRGQPLAQRPYSPRQHPRQKWLGERQGSPAFIDSSAMLQGRQVFPRTNIEGRQYTASPVPRHLRPQGYEYHDNRLEQHPQHDPHARHNPHERRFQGPLPYIQPPVVPTRMVPNTSSLSTPPRSLQPFRSTPSPLSNDSTRRTQQDEKYREETTRQVDTAPYVGFVQRVKNILEERMSAEQAHRSVSKDSPPSQKTQNDCSRTNGVSSC